MTSMTSLERVAKVLAHSIPDRVPVALHNYLMACRMAGGNFRDTLRDGDALAEMQLSAWRIFGHDVIMHENGVCAEAEAMGCTIRYSPDLPPHVEVPVVSTFDDIDTLTVPDPETTFPLNELLKAVRIIARETRGTVFINGRADQGPVALAMALCGPERFLTAIMEPDLRPRIRQLLDICSRMNIALGEAMARAGAHSSTIGAAGTSLLSPSMYLDLEFPGNRAFCEAMRRAGISGCIHVCGKETHLLDNLMRTGADWIELDPATDPVLCKQATHGKTCVLGMLEPAHILGAGTEDDVRGHTLDIMRIMAPGGHYIMGPGCALPPDTPPDNIHAVMDCVRRYGVYAPDGTLPGLARHK